VCKRTFTVPRVNDHSLTQDEDGVWLFFNWCVLAFVTKTVRDGRQTQPRFKGKTYIRNTVYEERYVSRCIHQDIVVVAGDTLKALHRSAVANGSTDFSGSEVRLYLEDEVNAFRYKKVRYGGPGEKRLILVTDDYVQFIGLLIIGIYDAGILYHDFERKVALHELLNDSFIAATFDIRVLMFSSQLLKFS